MWRGMWRNVYTADAWTIASHVCWVLAATIGIVQFFWR